jgi:photosystem II stability/assembly factor-like uncharacterized protein
MKKLLIIVLATTLIFIGLATWNQSQKKNTETNSDAENTELTSINSISHGHGLAVDISDINKVYIATHHGLLVLINDKDLFRLGQSNDDFMGFSTHPSNPNIFISSGHPSNGGNIGFQKSEDAGRTWRKISEGLDGPVDFHAIAVSPVNTNLVFGWYRNRLQRSTDGGESWVGFNTKFFINSLIADPKDENVVYATSPQELGIMVSRDKGESWDRLSDELKDGIVTSLAIDPQDAQKMLSFSEKLGLAKSFDGGKSWQQLNETFNNEKIFFIAIARQNPDIMYALTEMNSIYKSENGGNLWKKIR